MHPNHILSGDIQCTRISFGFQPWELCAFAVLLQLGAAKPSSFILHKNKIYLMADPSYTENQYGSASATTNKYHIGSLERVPFVYKSLIGLSQEINQIS